MSCSNDRITKGSTWYWFLGPLDRDTGAILLSGPKPEVSYREDGGEPVPIPDASVTWGRYDANGYVTTGDPVYSLRVEVPPSGADRVEVTAVFSDPVHLVRRVEELYG